MAGSSPVLEDSSTLSLLDRRLLKLEKTMALISGLAIFSLMVLAVISVGGRNAFNMPLPGYVDWVEVVMPLIAFMGVSYVQRDGTHIRMDIIISRLKGRWLWAAELLSVLLIFCLILSLVWGSWAHFQRSFDFSAPLWSRDSSIDIGIPLWPFKLVVPVAFSVLCLRLLVQIWGFGRALVTGEDDPVAVPLVEDIAAIAAKEAQQMSDASSREG